MVAGDLVIIYAQYRLNGATISISATGGQTWNTAATNTGTNLTYSVFWCRFNGTWAANPSVTIGAGTNALSAIMYVYRPGDGNSSWGLNVGPNYSSTTATAQSITGLTTTAPKTVTMGFWASASANTWTTLTGAGWSKTGIVAQYRNTTTGQSHTAAYNINATTSAVANVSQTQSSNVLCLKSIMSWHELNDYCASDIVLTSDVTCTPTEGTLQNATVSSPVVPTSCGTAGGDVWYTFTAQSAYPVITLSSMGTNMDNNPSIQLLSGSCGALANVACVTGTAVTTLSLNTRTSPGGAGLTVGAIYYVRIYSNTLAPTGANWDFDICVTDPAPGKFDYSKSYINLSKRATGGTVDPGDSLEIRVTFVAFSGAADSLSYSDTVYKNKGLVLAKLDSISTRTNEGKNHKFFTDSNADSDAGWRTSYGANPDTAIQINFGAGASRSVRGKLRNTSKPSEYGGTCIIMCTYRVRVVGSYGTKIRFGGGTLTFRDSATGVLSAINFKSDSLIVYQSPGLCPNAVSAANAVGVESNGTFGLPAGGAPLARNRGTSSYVPGYIYNTFSSAGGGPQDYYYGIANNTSARFSILQNLNKPDPSSPQYRVFGLWDIIGDHTGAANTGKGNPPCDTTKPVSVTNPCGYMLIINSAFKTDTAFQYTVNSLCPNTNYEISAWVRNICYKCGCDSNGVGATSGGYIPFAPGDSSGVQPNLAFDVNGIDYYTTGNIPYIGTTPTKSDTSNRWLKRGFTYLTGPSQTSFTLTIRNNAPGGGGNDWAMDDIAVSTCLPNMKYSPSLNPTVCRLNPITIDDTVRSYFNNYVYYKWQRSTNNGASWSDATGPLGPATPTWNGSAWEYITSYTIPPAVTDTSDNGDLYRLIVATTSANLSNANCQFTDGISIINLNVLNCGVPLKTDLLSFNGKLENDKGKLFWNTSKEDEPLTFTIERSSDGYNFSTAGVITSHNNYSAETNSYSLVDPVAVTGKIYYRLIMTDQSNAKKYSRIIQLSGQDGILLSLSNIINPFKYTIEFDITTPVDTKIEVELLDLFGKMVRKNSYLVHTGINALSMTDTESLPAGTYIFRIRNNDLIINRKVLKKDL